MEAEASPHASQYSIQYSNEITLDCVGGDHITLHSFGRFLCLSAVSISEVKWVQALPLFVIDSWYVLKKTQLV